MKKEAGAVWALFLLIAGEGSLSAFEANTCKVISGRVFGNLGPRRFFFTPGVHCIQTSFQITQRRFASLSPPTTPSLYDLVAPSFIKINGNCLKEIAASGSPDFVRKSYVLMQILKRSFQDGEPISGQNGLSDAEADWKSAWEDMNDRQQASLKEAYGEICNVLKTADRVFYNIK